MILPSGRQEESPSGLSRGFSLVLSANGGLNLGVRCQRLHPLKISIARLHGMVHSNRVEGVRTQDKQGSPADEPETLRWVRVIRSLGSHIPPASLGVSYPLGMSIANWSCGRHDARAHFSGIRERLVHPSSFSAQVFI